MITQIIILPIFQGYPQLTELRVFQLAPVMRGPGWAQQLALAQVPPCTNFVFNGFVGFIIPIPASLPHSIGSKRHPRNHSVAFLMPDQLKGWLAACTRSVLQLTRCPQKIGFDFFPVFYHSYSNSISFHTKILK